jgi:hypothetical protein
MNTQRVLRRLAATAVALVFLVAMDAPAAWAGTIDKTLGVVKQYQKINPTQKEAIAALLTAFWCFAFDLEERQAGTSGDEETFRRKCGKPIVLDASAAEGRGLAALSETLTSQLADALTRADQSKVSALLPVIATTFRDFGKFTKFHDPESTCSALTPVERAKQAAELDIDLVVLTGRLVTELTKILTAIQ